jgi:hypothetical protein
VDSVPEVQASIKTGELNLTTVSQVQNFFKIEGKTNKSYSKEQKLELIETLQSKSSREVEKKLVSLNPEVLFKQETIRHVNDTQVKVQIVISDQLLKKIERLKELTSHKNQTITDILEELVTQELKKKDPETRASAQKLSSESELKTKAPSMQSRYIPVKIKDEIWQRDQSRCTYIDIKTKHRCEARRYLQIDHIHPWALGGASTGNNLRLLCSEHNKFVARQIFGTKYGQ